MKRFDIKLTCAYLKFPSTLRVKAHFLWNEGTFWLCQLQWSWDIETTYIIKSYSTTELPAIIWHLNYLNAFIRVTMMLWMITDVSEWMSIREITESWRPDIVRNIPNWYIWWHVRDAVVCIVLTVWNRLILALMVSRRTLTKILLQAVAHYIKIRSPPAMLQRDSSLHTYNKGASKIMQLTGMRTKREGLDMLFLFTTTTTTTTTTTYHTFKDVLV